MPPSILEAPDLVLRLRAGEAAIIPTDTLPGLAVMPAQAQTLWSLKRRPADKPLILMGATVDDLLQISSKSLKKNALIPSIFSVEDQ